MKKYLLIISITILLPLMSVAQNFEDALRYSNFKLEGTARSGAMGNAFGSLGGDFTGVGINPAGLGIYRSSEFSLTPNFGMNKVEATYLDGDNMSDNSLKFRMNNGSYVAALPNNKSSQSGLVSINLGIGFNRLRDYNSYAVVNGTNAQSSFLDHLTENANKGIWSDYYEEVASKADVLLYDNNLQEYWNDIREAGYGHDQRKSYQRSGALDEYTLALGLNFNHKLYLGASLGIIDVYYKENTTLIEEDANDEIDFFDYLNFRTSLRTFGTGYNFKIGVIYKPVNNIRLGASLASPTYYNLHDNFETNMASSITEGSETKTYHPYSPILEYDYDLMTPFKATLSGAVIIGKKGLISGDVEILDYTITKLRNGGDGYDFMDENQDINDIYKSVANFRVGGEYKVSDPFALRAGFEFYPSVFNSTAFGQEQPNADVNYSVISAGFGYKSGSFFLDAAYRLSAFTDYAQLYPAPKTADYPKPAMAKFDTTNGKLLVTLGFRF